MNRRRLGPATQAAVAPKARLLSALGGGRPSVLAVAPLYLSLYLAKRRHEAYGREWRRRAEAGGGSVAVRFEDEVAVQREVWYQGYEVFAEPPDWLSAPPGGPRAFYEGCEIRLEDDACCRCDATGHRTRIDAPFSDASAPLWKVSDPPRTPGEIASRIDVPEPANLAEAGWFDLTRQLVAEVGEEYALYWSTGSPYTACYAYLGFEGMMLAMREQPEIMTAIAERRLQQVVAWAAAARNAGLELVFVEEWACGADLISPRDYRTFAWPFERDLCRELRRLGFRTVFYFCGSIDDRLAEIRQLEAEALAFEESKKGFKIDIGDVRREVGAERCLFGNLDVTRVRDADAETLRQEVFRQVEAAGPGAFVASTGSPLTLDTAPCRVDRLMATARSYQ